MSDNNKLTKREVFEQIVKLQEQMLGNSNALYRLTEAIDSICSEDLDMDGDERREAIEYVCVAFQRKEQTFMEMILTYQKIYDGLKD